MNLFQDHIWWVSDWSEPFGPPGLHAIIRDCIHGSKALRCANSNSCLWLLCSRFLCPFQACVSGTIHQVITVKNWKSLERQSCPSSEWTSIRRCSNISSPLGSLFVYAAMHPNVNMRTSHLSSGWPVPCADDSFILLSLHIHLRPVKTGPFQVILLDCGSLINLLLAASF